MNLTRCLSIALLAACVLVPGCSQYTPPPAPVPGIRTAQVLTVDGVENLHRVSPTLYRSGQPEPKAFTALQSLGVRSVLNLREYHKDTRRARHTGMYLMAYPIAAGQLNAADVENCLRLIARAPKPVLVHCWHGSDRTGTIVAAWRIVYENCSVDAAIAEFRQECYGHHEFWYPNLVELLRTTDWDAMRRRLQADVD